MGGSGRRHRGYVFEDPDGAWLSQKRADAFLHSASKVVFGPKVPVLPAAPNTDNREDPGVVEGAPRLPVHVPSLSDRLAPQIPQHLPDPLLVPRLDPPFDDHLYRQPVPSPSQFRPFGTIPLSPFTPEVRRIL